MPAPTSSTLIDLVNDVDEPIGTIARGDVFSEGAAFRVVHVLVMDKTGRILLQQVGSHRDRSPLRWGSSVAGYLAAGEDYVSAAIRRLAEELGLTTDLTKLGEVRMLDNGATKFISLFQTISAQARNELPQHIQDLKFWTVEQIENTLRTDPASFTETFPIVYGLFRTATTGQRFPG